MRLCPSAMECTCRLFKLYLFGSPLEKNLDLLHNIKCREVEDFARRLNSDWPERMQEILSLGHDMKPLRHSTKGNGTIRRYASMLTILYLFSLYYTVT